MVSTRDIKAIDPVTHDGEPQVTWDKSRSDEANKSDLLGIVVVVGIVASFIGGIAMAIWSGDAGWLFLSLGAFIILFAG